jgi:hypothetical protein
LRDILLSFAVDSLIKIGNQIQEQTMYSFHVTKGTSKKGPTEPSSAQSAQQPQQTEPNYAEYFLHDHNRHVDLLDFARFVRKNYTREIECRKQQ